ncbi:MAG TPA: hypothetical protein VG737_00525 [Cyclobacteriaceae bacterium]|nr:hypothetical protein [Cyclobacteriaceae bacterium]
MNQAESVLRAVLWIHIAGGTLALITGLGAILTSKGSNLHRKFGKAYFWSMSTVFVSALVLAVGHSRMFLLMVAFFSYYMTVRGYRMLYRKKLGAGVKVKFIDWFVTVVSGTFMLCLIGWGLYQVLAGNSMGIVGIVFGLFGSMFAFQDVKSFVNPPADKMHWWYGHIGGMGGSYISALTAFIVVNIQIPQYGWTLWVTPPIIGGMLIGMTVRRYKAQFAK